MDEFLCHRDLWGYFEKKVTRHFKQEPPSPTAQLKMFAVARPKQSLCTIFKRKYNLLDLFKCIKIFWAFIFDVMWQ